MSKRPKKMMIGLLSLAELAGEVRHRCAWKGCRESYAFKEELPTGWRWLSLWYGPPGLPPWAAGCTELRDAVLCPEHSLVLHNELLEDIGQRLDETKGSA